MHRFHSRSARYPALVRLPLVHRGHLRRSPPPSRVETQRQWSDQAIARTTPALLGLFSLIALWADQHCTAECISPQQASWYAKPLPTFADALVAVRRALWQS